MFDSLVLSHLQFGITCWDFEWERIFRLQKRVLRIMMNNKYNAHTDPLFKDLEMLKVNDIFDVQCLKLWYKFVHNELPHFFKSMFTYNYELYEQETCSPGMLHLYPTRTADARNDVIHCIPVMLLKFPTHLEGKVRTHSIGTFVAHIKSYMICWYSMSALRWTGIYVSVTRNDYGMFIISDFYISHSIFLKRRLNFPSLYFHRNVILFRPSL